MKKQKMYQSLVNTVNLKFIQVTKKNHKLKAKCFEILNAQNPIRQQLVKKPPNLILYLFDI